GSDLRWSARNRKYLFFGRPVFARTTAFKISNHRQDGRAVQGAAFRSQSTSVGVEERPLRIRGSAHFLKLAVSNILPCFAHV
ncbi:hypothetical protein M514_21716, partial [Trichuris suis]